MLTREEIKANLISAEKTPFGYKPKGSPFIIKLNTKNLDDLATALSSGEPPFNILGIKSKVVDDEYVIYGTDIKNGCPIEMEVTSEWITVHLRRVPGDNDGKDCVDTLMRLFENIRKHVENAQLECEGIEERDGGEGQKG